MKKTDQVKNSLLFSSVSKMPAYRGKLTVNSSAIWLLGTFVCGLDAFLKLTRREEFIQLLDRAAESSKLKKEETLKEMVRRVIREETGVEPEGSLEDSSVSDKEIINYYKGLLQISKKNWNDPRIKLSPLSDTISQFSRSGNDTTHIRKLIKDLGLE